MQVKISEFADGKYGVSSMQDDLTMSMEFEKKQPLAEYIVEVPEDLMDNFDKYDIVKATDDDVATLHIVPR